jgi:colanic acid biosynthesis glycosyl transferase WcaI
VTRSTFLIISQVYVPDPAAAGQYCADVAAEMVRRGHHVVVLTSANGYDDPSCRYPAHETVEGVAVRRFSLSSFGKSSLTLRVLSQFIFLCQAVATSVFTSGLCGVLVPTSPPLCGIAGAIVSKVRRVPFTYWLMDLNPDQMIAMKLIRKNSVSARVFDALNRSILRRATDVIVLDRFMRERLLLKLDVRNKTTEIPPWPRQGRPGGVSHSENPFRKEHGLQDRFVVMYSGNHSPVNPIRTLLDAAERLQDDPRLVTVWIGGGLGKSEVEERLARGVRNVRSLPYQPQDRTQFSLAAADVHLVSLGDDLVGIVHPCKVYDAMAVSRPILYLGPRPCHVSDLIERHRIGWQIQHGDIDGAVQVLREMMATSPEELEAMGRRAAGAVNGSLSKRTLIGQLCELLERGLSSPH